MAEAKKPTKESAKAKGACEQYLLLGPYRSLAKLAEALGKPPGYVRTLKEWSREFKWQEKAQEYDHDLLMARRQKHEAMLDRMNEEHLLWSRTQALNALEMIADLKKKASYSLQSANQLFNISTTLQRTAADSITRQLVEKEGGIVQEDVIIRTIWGRNTDPRPRYDNPTEPAATAQPATEEPTVDAEEPEIRVEFGKDDTDEPQ